MPSYLQIENISKSYGPKILFERIGFNVNEGDKIALIAPDATISIIRDYYVADKYKVKLDGHIIGLARCSNPNCITNRGEPVAPEFAVEGTHPPKLRCCYCDRILTNITDNLL